MPLADGAASRPATGLKTPGVSESENLWDVMRTTGGGKVVAGLVDGKNAPPPGTVDLLSRLGQVDIS